jgi:hypothetical protein
MISLQGQRAKVPTPEFSHQMTLYICLTGVVSSRSRSPMSAAFTMLRRRFAPTPKRASRSPPAPGPHRREAEYAIAALPRHTPPDIDAGPDSKRRSQPLRLCLSLEVIWRSHLPADACGTVPRSQPSRSATPASSPVLAAVRSELVPSIPEAASGRVALGKPA